MFIILMYLPYMGVAGKVSANSRISSAACKAALKETRDKEAGRPKKTEDLLVGPLLCIVDQECSSQFSDYSPKQGDLSCTKEEVRERSTKTVFGARETAF